MISLMGKTRKLVAKSLGCGDCTMLEGWCTSTIQRPSKCKLNELFIHCPVTGKMPFDWDKCNRDLRYYFVDEEEDDGVESEAD